MMVPDKGKKDILQTTAGAGLGPQLTQCKGMKGGASVEPRVSVAIEAAGIRRARTWLGRSRDSAKGCDLCQTVLCLLEPQFPKKQNNSAPPKK